MANTLQTLPLPDQRTTRFYQASVDTASTLKDLDGGACSVHSIKAEVSTGSDFLLMWDDVNPSLGTTAPHWQFPTTTDLTLEFTEAVAFSDGLTITVTNVGGTAASGNPSNANTVALVVEN